MSVSPVQILMVLLCCSLSTVSGIGLYHHLTAGQRVRLAVVDLASVYREREAAFAARIGKETATEADRVRAVEDAQVFARALPVVIERLSQECGCVVLLGNAVVGRTDEVVDLTEDLRKRVGSW